MNFKYGFFILKIFGVLISVILGSLIGWLYAEGEITNILTATKAVFVFGVASIVSLIGATLFSSINRVTGCIYKNVIYILSGIIGTIVSSLIAISLILTPSIAAGILIGIVAFFFFLSLVGLIILILCTALKSSSI